MSRRLTKRYLTPAEDYQCPLSAETQAIAEVELRETENSRSQALASLRSWLEQNPKIMAIRMDSNFLLRFLRTKKFSVPMAQEAIERYILLRQSWGIAFNQLDHKLPVMMEIIDLGYIFVSPFKDKNGRRIVIYRPGTFKTTSNRTNPDKSTFSITEDSGEVTSLHYRHLPSGEMNASQALTVGVKNAPKWYNKIIVTDSEVDVETLVDETPGVFDPYKYTNQDMCRVMAMCYETLMEDEESQVRGLVHFADGAGVSFPHLTLFTPKEAVRIVKNGERTIPMRHKEIYGVNVHATVKFALDFGMALISEKIRKRVNLYTALEEVEIDKKLLPQEYGGAMPMKEMIELWKVELASKRDILLLSDKMAVRLEMYSEAAREGAISALRAGANTCAGADAVGDAMRGLTGNFRKLEVD